jgi:hypothetical protein
MRHEAACRTPQAAGDGAGLYRPFSGLTFEQPLDTDRTNARWVAALGRSVHRIGIGSEFAVMWERNIHPFAMLGRQFAMAPRFSHRRNRPKRLGTVRDGSMSGDIDQEINLVRQIGDDGATITRAETHRKEGLLLCKMRKS